MNDKGIINILKINLWLLLMMLAVAILSFSFFSGRSVDMAAAVGKKLEKRLDGRMQKLETYMVQVLEEDRDQWPELNKFPQDMVVYRYENDTLKSWNNQFSLDNDDIGNKVFVPRFSNLRYNVVSPLTYADTVVSYMNMGSRWYLVKSIDDGAGCKVIGGLLVKDSFGGDSYNGVNRRLRISDRFAIHPVSYSGGAPVYVEGVPLMKIIQENASVIPLLPDPKAIWLAFLMLLAAVFIFLSRRCNLTKLTASLGMVTIICVVFFFLGMGMRSASDIFSPTVYSDDGPFYSFGALLIINVWIFSMVNCFYIGRKRLLRYLEERNTRRRMTAYAISIMVGICAIAVYVHGSLRSLIANSNINLSLYQVSGISQLTVYAYLSYLLMFLAIAMLIHMLGPVARKWKGWRFNIFGSTGRIAFAVLSAAYLLVMTSVLGFTKEVSRTEIWANRLAVDRNLGFEIQLRSMEQAIANDVMIPTLIPIDKNFSVIISRIQENYISALTGDYNVNIYMFKDSDPDAAVLNYFNDRMRNGTPLADNSRFIYSRSSVGRAQYTGVFTYYNDSVGVVRLLIAIESKADYEGSGYETLIGVGSPGTVSLPANYSYGKYLDSKLVAYRGEYPYPTVLYGRLEKAYDTTKRTHARIDGYVHFLTPVSDSEFVVISRKVNDVVRYLVAGFMVALVAYFISIIPRIGGRRKRQFEKNYYKQRINTVLLLSLISTLIAMASISVLFIYRRNDSNLNDLMVGKINIIQSLVQADSRYFTSAADFTSNEFRSSLDNVGGYTNSGITLYRTDGKVLMSTFPEIFDRLVIGTRLNGESYRNIVYSGRRYYICKEKIGGHRFYTMSAPVLDTGGNMLAIVSSPYTDAGLSFRDDALFHASFVVTVFFILLLLARFVTARVVDKMFRPLVDMGRKMKLAKTSGLEYIIYDRDDEIASVVDSYNRMVHDLSESSKQAAQLERDKAWSEMARQVAHEIKNPLTPIKLQIQRIIRLKSKNDPSWQEKFDGIISVVMDSIDQLTDTANEFSTFAKLYSEEPVEINLDKLASDEVALFDDKDNITFQYIGLNDAVVMGPKPQLTRVFVNLLTNSVQAIEGRQKEEEEAGNEPAHGHINLSIRNSVKDGFYDIVVEDDGPGVKDENRGRLFTPNFTTKSSGTGLGLAICKNILDRCGGEISYSKSFALGGACFTIRYPKKK